MKVCVYGAGAVGGYLAVNLSLQPDAEVSVIARGPHLRAIRDRGLELRSAQGSVRARLAEATDDPFSLPGQDLVLVAAKAHSLPGAATGIAALLDRDGTAIFFNNGIPWWWAYHGGTVGDGALELVDPGGALWSEVGPQRALGAVVYSANEVIEPGVVLHSGQNRWVLGEPDGSSSSRLKKVVALFRRAGIEAEPSPEIRRDIWEKLLINLTSAPVATLTRLYSSEVRHDPELHRLQQDVFNECLAIPAAMGIRIDKGYEDLSPPPEGTRPSMLQDVLAGRPIEVEAILGQARLFAQEHGVETPRLDVILTLLRGLGLSISRHGAV